LVASVVRCRVAATMGAALAWSCGGAPREAPPQDAAADAMPDAPPADAPAGVADLQFVAAEMTNSWIVMSDVFPADDCAVVEGCIGGPGRRLLLRFDTVTTNRGTADVFVGAPPAPGVSNETFVWSPCHKHHHVRTYTIYELVGPSG